MQLCATSAREKRQPWVGERRSEQRAADAWLRQSAVRRSSRLQHERRVQQLHPTSAFEHAMIHFAARLARCRSLAAAASAVLAAA